MNKPINVQTVELVDGRIVCLSYGVIVAAFIPRGTATATPFEHSDGIKRYSSPVAGYVRTDARFSVTTSKHMNHFAGKDAPMVPHAELCMLCAPIASRL